LLGIPLSMTTIGRPSPSPRLVVRDVNHRRLQPLMKFGDLGPHPHPRLGVEVGERFVEEKDLGLAHDGTADGDSLPLAAGKCFWFAIE